MRPVLQARGHFVKRALDATPRARWGGGASAPGSSSPRVQPLEDATAPEFDEDVALLPPKLGPPPLPPTAAAGVSLSPRLLLAAARAAAASTWRRVTTPAARRWEHFLATSRPGPYVAAWLRRPSRLSPATIEALHNRLLCGLLAFAALNYAFTLAAIPNPDWLVNNFSRLSDHMALTLYSLGAVPVYCALHPGLIRRQRLRFAGATIAWLAFFIVLDHGASLQSHGAYNLTVLLGVLLPAWGLFAGCWGASRALGGRRLAAGIGLLFLCFIPFWAVRLWALHSTWTAGLLGRRLVSAGQPLADGWDGGALGGPKGGPAHGSHRGAHALREERTAGSASPPASMPSAWTGCDWPLSSSWVPLYDVLPAGAQNFWLGDWRHCPAKSEPAFHASVALDWGAVTADDVAAGARNCDARDTHPRAPGRGDASPPPPPGAAGPWVPATLTVTCALRHGVRMWTYPDSQAMTVAEREGDVLAEAVRRRLDASLQVLRASGGGSGDAVTLTHVIPSNVFGETFQVECGADNSTVTINRPSLPVLLRSAAQWGAHSPIAELLKPHAPRPTRPAPHKPFNVLMIVLDATSRIHIHRKLPKTLAVLEELAARGRGEWGPGGDDGPGGHHHHDEPPPGGSHKRHARESGPDSDHRRRGDAHEHEPRRHGDSHAEAETAARATSSSASAPPPSRVFEFFRYHAVDFATHLTTVPLYTGGCGRAPNHEPIWETFRRSGGYATALLNGMCEDWGLAFAGYPTFPDHETLGVTCSTDTYGLLDPFGAVKGPYSFRRRCHGDQYEHRTHLAYGRSFWANYADVPKYLHMVFLEGHEGSGEVLGLMDDDLAAFLRDVLLTGGGAEDTALILMSDHGLHVGVQFLWTEQGRSEHMMAALFTSLPTRFAAGQDDGAPLFSAPLLDTVELNQQYLVASFDVYWTLRALLGGATRGLAGLVPHGRIDAPDAPAPLCPAPDYRPWRPHNAAPAPHLHSATFVSLFDPIAMDRTCAAAHIEPKYCRCK